ncbi:MAG: FkbM family methyltransferase [Lacunisphaera sp.]
MSIRQNVRSIPVLHFAARLPVYWRRFASERRKWNRALLGDTLCPAENIAIRTPDHAIAHEVFESMVFETAGAVELREFLGLADGCASFVDLGASGGFFSAVFACSRPGSATVLSVEPDPVSVRVLDSVRSKNTRAGIDWKIAAVGVAAMAGRIAVMADDAHYGVSVMQGNQKAGEVPVVPLARLCAEQQISPDLIKIDIESMEYEVVLSSLDFLKLHRPRLHLELHSPFLVKQGRDPKEIMTALFKLGYRFRHATTPADFLAGFDPDKILRLDLVPSA